MGYNFENLEPLVRQILSAPGTDLTTISAKRVRRELLTLDSSLTPEFVKENKPDVDAVITRVFGEFAERNGEVDDTPEEPVTASRRYNPSDLEEAGQEEEDEEEEKPTKARRRSKNEMSDAELARQLSSEINGRSSARRSTGKGRVANGTSKRLRKKSATTIDSDDEDSGEEGGKKTKKKRAGGGAAKGGFAKEFTLSAPLAALLQVEKLSRPQVVKQLWVYIKENERQNPNNRREILCDQNLRAIFNVDKIDMFKMNKVLGSHLHEE